MLSATDSTYSGLTGKLGVTMRRTFPEFNSLGGETVEAFIPQIYRRVFS